jgi:hypothetical protein
MLHCVDLTFGAFVPSMCYVIQYFSSYSFIGHYRFQRNWPSSGVLVVVVKDYAAHCNAVFFPPIVVASVILVMWVTITFIYVSLGLHVVAFL